MSGYKNERVEAFYRELFRLLKATSGVESAPLEVVPVLRGGERDSKTWGKKVLSNEKMAQLYFSGRDAVSGHIGWGGDPGTKTDIEIIGVVSDTKYEGCSKKAACPIRRVRWDLVAARAAVG